MIKEVKVLCPIVYYNKHHDRDYFDNKGVMIITLFSGDKYMLDLTSNTDITTATKDYIELRKVSETKEIVLFKNVLKCCLQIYSLVYGLKYVMKKLNILVRRNVCYDGTQ